MNCKVFGEFLRLNVPSEIAAIASRGGLNDLDLEWLRQEENDDDDNLSPLNILMRADSLLLYPNLGKDRAFKQAVVAQLVLRKTIALMAFFPGGITIFGWHFCSTIPGYVQSADERFQWLKDGVRW